MTAHAEFETALARDGFPEVATAAMAPNEIRPEHTHDFDVRALILDGDITLTIAGEARTYRTGDVFAMARGCPHAEAVGADGVRYVVGRRR